MKRIIILYCIILFSTILIGSDLYANGSEGKLIKPLSGEIEFDGKITEAAWKLSQEFPMTMHFPVYNNAPSEKSEVYITYDNDYLWVGAILYYDDVSNMVSTSKKRDEQSKNSDSFGILLDSYEDNENALAFFTLPSGAKIDYSVSNDGQGGAPGPGMGSTNYTWNSYWDVKTVVLDDAWHVEMRIPFSSLRFQNVNNITKMGLIINRSISHLNETDTYPAIDTKYGRGANTRPSLAETIVFENIKPVNPLYISPYVLGGTNIEHKVNETGDEYLKESDPKFTGGLDVKYNVNNNLTLDFTVNTDFAQVEADDEQVNLTRYSLFFPEKRLFFQERSGIFSYELSGQQNLFYSRNIGLVNGEPVTIYGGVRAVGRIGKWDVGVLSMQTEEFDGVPSENFGVARLRKQVINENSYIGGMLTSRLDFDGSYNVAYGLDGIFRLTDVDYLTVKMAQTQDNSIDADMISLDPTFFTIEMQRRAEKGLTYQGKYAYWGKDFNPRSGFIFMNNIHEVMGSLRYGWFPGEKSPIFNFSVGTDLMMTKRMVDDKIESMRFGPQFSMDLKNGYSMFAGVNYNREGVLNGFPLSPDIFIEPGEYTFYAFRTNFMSPKTNRVGWNAGIDGGEFYDGTQFSANLGADLNLSKSFQISATYKFDNVKFADDNKQFTNNLARLKATYMMNTKVTMSAFLQYNELENIVISNFRLRYNPRDGNDFYLVFNDSRYADKSDLSPVPPSYLSRTILLKYTHTFKL